MAGKFFIQIEAPVTQSTEAVKALLKFYNHDKEVADLPPFYRLGAEMVLVLGNKGDAYYVTTPRGCSCPTRSYHPGQPCKHMRRYFSAPKAESQAMEKNHGAPLKLAQTLKDSIRPEGRWPGGFNGPVAKIGGMA